MGYAKKSLLICLLVASVPLNGMELEKSAKKPKVVRWQRTELEAGEIPSLLDLAAQGVALSFKDQNSFINFMFIEHGDWDNCVPGLGEKVVHHYELNYRTDFSKNCSLLSGFYPDYESLHLTDYGKDLLWIKPVEQTSSINGKVVSTNIIDANSIIKACLLPNKNPSCFNVDPNIFHIKNIDCVHFPLNIKRLITRLSLDVQCLKAVPYKLLKGMKNLKQLSLKYNEITQVDALPELSKLETINLTSNPIEKISAEALNSLPNIKTLKLQDINMLDNLDHVKTLFEGLKGESNQIIFYKGDCSNNRKKEIRALGKKMLPKGSKVIFEKTLDNAYPLLFE